MRRERGEVGEERRREGEWKGGGGREKETRQEEKHEGEWKQELCNYTLCAYAAVEQLPDGIPVSVVGGSGAQVGDLHSPAHSMKRQFRRPQPERVLDSGRPAGGFGERLSAPPAAVVHV